MAKCPCRCDDTRTVQSLAAASVQVSPTASLSAHWLHPGPRWNSAGFSNRQVPQDIPQRIFKTDSATFAKLVSWQLFTFARPADHQGTITGRRRLPASSRPRHANSLAQAHVGHVPLLQNHELWSNMLCNCAPFGHSPPRCQVNRVDAGFNR